MRWPLKPRAVHARTHTQTHTQAAGFPTPFFFFSFFSLHQRAALALHAANAQTHARAAPDSPCGPEGGPWAAGEKGQPLRSHLAKPEWSEIEAYKGKLGAQRVLSIDCMGRGVNLNRLEACFGRYWPCFLWCAQLQGAGRHTNAGCSSSSSSGCRGPNTHLQVHTTFGRTFRTLGHISRHFAGRDRVPETLTKRSAPFLRGKTDWNTYFQGTHVRRSPQWRSCSRSCKKG